MEIRFSESGTDRMDTQRERDRVKTSGIMIGTGYVWNGLEKPGTGTANWNWNWRANSGKTGGYNGENGAQSVRGK